MQYRSFSQLILLAQMTIARVFSLASHHEADLVLDVVLAILGHAQVIRGGLGGGPSPRARCTVVGQ